MKRYLPLLFVALLVSGGILIWRYHNLTSPSNILSDPDNAAPPTREPQPDSSAPLPGAAPTPPPENVAPAFVSFLAAEATNMDSPRIDADLAQKRMEEQTAKMGENELSYARDLVLGDQYPANQRIVAAAMLGLTGKKGWRVASDIAGRSFGTERAAPHSMDEVKTNQAKALALMVIDGIAEQAAKNPEARDQLHRMAKEAKDATVVKHIQRKLKELPPL